MDSWQRDWGRPERVLFLRESWAYRAQRLSKTLLRERNFWVVLALCALYFAANVLEGVV